MRTKARNEQGSFDLKQPGRTPEEELWKALAWMQRAGIGALIHAYREAAYVHGTLGRTPVEVEYPERCHEIRLQHEALDRGERIAGKLGDPMWTAAIELFRGAHDLYRPLIARARAALPRVRQTMDDTSLPVAQRFTARVSRLIDRLDEAMPSWIRHEGQHPGDEYVQRFDGFPDPSGLVDLFPELEEVLAMLRGVWGVDRDPDVVERPAAIKRVFELVRSDPEAFRETIAELESRYTPEFIEEARLETLAHERDAGLLARFKDRDVDLDDLARWKKGEARCVLPSHLLNSMKYEDMAALVPLRLALYHAREEKWYVDQQTSRDRERTARRYAVLTALAFDPDVEDYLGPISAWARLGWPEGEWEAGPESWGRMIADIADVNPDAWAKRCERVVRELTECKRRASALPEPKPVPEDVSDILTDSEVRAVRAEHEARSQLHAHDANPTLARIFDCICANEFENYSEPERGTWERTRRRANRKLRQAGIEV